MNIIFQEIVQNSTLAVNFLTWYNKKYQDIQTFKESPFEHQLGVFLKYFEEVKHMTLNANPTGYIIYYLDQKVNLDKMGNQSGYFFEKFECPTDTVMNNYMKGVSWLIKNNELPF